MVAGGWGPTFCVFKCHKKIMVYTLGIIHIFWRYLIIAEKSLMGLKIGCSLGSGDVGTSFLRNQ